MTTVFKFRSNRDKKEIIQPHEVKTFAQDNYGRSDSNKDGIPDYLQRPEIQSLIKTNKDLNQWEVDTQKEVEEWIMGLQGYEFDGKEDKYKPYAPPTINTIGAKQTQTFVKALISKHSINTALSEEDVHEICKICSLTYAKWLKNKAKIWKVANSDLSPLLWQFDQFVYLVLTRAIGDRQRKHTSERTRLTGSTGNVPQASFP